MFVGGRLMPVLLGRVVNTRSRELFVLAALTVAVGTALASAAFFDVSLALGAFVAGVVVSESPFSHQIGADLLPFREAFAVVFFVSVGMLVNPVTSRATGIALVLVSPIVVGKGLVSGALAVLLGPARTALVLAAGRGQIGEFSFIVGQSGLGARPDRRADVYSLILAGAIISITLNPFAVSARRSDRAALKRSAAAVAALNRHGAPAIRRCRTHADHVVIVGCGRVGRHIAEALGDCRFRVSSSRPTRAAREAAGARRAGAVRRRGQLRNSRTRRAGTRPRARDHAAGRRRGAGRGVTVRHEAPDLRIVARASTWDGARRLKAAGVNDVVRPELEGGVEIVRRTLLDLDLPVSDVQRYVDLVRSEGMDEAERPSADRARVLDDLLSATRGARSRLARGQSVQPAGRDHPSASRRSVRRLARLLSRSAAPAG